MDFFVENWIGTLGFVIGAIALIANTAMKSSNAPKTYATKTCGSCQANMPAAYGPCGKCGVQS